MISSDLDQAVSLICSLEGFRSRPYRDVTGTWTVGYGSTRWEGQSVTQTHPMSVTEAQARVSVSQIASGVLKALKSSIGASLTPNQWAALTSFAYNVGLSACLNSTLVRLVKEQQLDKAADQFLLWDKSKGQVIPGLLNRRKAERLLFLGNANV
ncbi:lysozyme [Acetobacter orientalis]|uniref:lysozyme n=1 Tax=Acetobacter orientalis TaxID=146474 RepID=UPI003868A93C